MKTKLNAIMLIDDDDDDISFYNEIIFNKFKVAEKIIKFQNGQKALIEIKNKVMNSPNSLPELIILDLNMPRLNGWEFIAEFEKISTEHPILNTIILIVSSVNSEEREIHQKYKSVNAYVDKPLDKAKIDTILSDFFV